jgi:hypothetical protein
MRSCRRLLLTFIITASCATVVAQDADSLLLSQVETEFSFEDSLSIFNLIDSLLQNGEVEGSQVAVRLAYNSNVLSTGRTLGIENFGLSPGVSYYHKSGLYADVSGYWSKDFEPSYYLTVTSLGYMHDFSKHFSFMAGYDRYFYSIGGDHYIPYKNALSVTPIIEFKPLSLSTTYSFYFGDAHVHRIMPGINVLLQKKKFLNIDRVAVTPSFFILLGNEVFTVMDYIPPKNRLEGLYNLREYYSWDKPVPREKNVFGVMNYAISVPLSVSYKKWGFAFSYTYNIPKALSGEPLTISESSYLSGSLTYFISLNKTNLSL